MSNERECVTILLPTFNAVTYIDATILSLLSQTKKNMQILAYDDHSDDGTYERLCFWSTVDQRITSRRPFSSNYGCCHLLNQMIDDTHTYYIARQDHDDMSLPQRIQTQFDFMETKKDAVLCGTQMLSIIENEQNRIADDYPWESTFINPIASRDTPIDSVLKERPRIIGGVMFGIRNVIRKVGSFDQQTFPVEDWDMNLKLLQEGRSYVLPQILYLRRIHDRELKSQTHRNLQVR